MLKESKSPAAAAIARAHAEAWSNQDYDMAQKCLAPDVTISIATTLGYPKRISSGSNDYIRGLTEFAKSITPCSRGQWTA